MQKDHWQKIEETFKQAVALSPTDRRRFVEKTCGDNSEICHEVLALLEADMAEENFLDEPLFILGARLLETEDLFSKESDFAFYRIKKLLGRGGMGTVYLAEDKRLGRLVALKILPGSLGTDHEIVERFRQEARTASKISHPNVAHIYEFGEENKRYFLAMEYIEGITLRELLNRKKISVEDALDFVLQIVEALSATHRRGIIHRDIKPENIIVNENNLIKVLDFGVAKLLDIQTPSGNFISPDTDLVNTAPGMLMGTIGYIAPEQLRNKKADFRVDIWSLGVVFYEILSGQRPFRGETAEAVRNAILKHRPQALFDVGVKSEEVAFLQKVITKTLHKNPDKRYKSASDLASDLKKIKRQYIEKFPVPENQSKNINTKEQTQNPTFLTKSKKFWNRQSLPLKAVFISSLICFLTFGFGLFATYFDPTASIKNRRQTVLVKTKIESLAVLPFDNKTGDRRIDFLSKGLTDDLIRNLGEANLFPVISLTSSQRIKDRKWSHEKIKQNIQIEKLLEGEIVKENENLFIKTRLVDLTDSRTVWEERLNISDGNLLKLRNALTLLLSNKLQDNEHFSKKLIFAEYPTANDEAYRLYLEAKFGRTETTVKEIKRLISFLEKSVALDPNYSLALVALAENYNLLGTFLGQSPEYYQPKAKETLEKAIAIDNSLSEAHTLLGKIKMDYDRDWVGCEREFKRAIEINPNNELAHHWYGEVYLSAMGRLDESIKELEISRRLNPLSSGILTGLAWSYTGKGDYQKAVDLCDEAQRVNPEDNDIFHYKAQALFKLNLFDEAVEQMNEAIKNDDKNTRYYALKAVFMASKGKREEAAKILSQLKNKPVSKYSLAIVENALGNRDRAFELLNEELKTESVDLLSIKIDPLLDGMRNDPRFAELEKKLDLPD